MLWVRHYVFDVALWRRKHLTLGGGCRRSAGNRQQNLRTRRIRCTQGLLRSPSLPS